FFEKWRALWAHAHTLNVEATLLSAGTLAILIGWPHVSRRVPGPFVALLAATIATAALGLDVETIGSRFGEISGALPAPRIPNIGWDAITGLAVPAFTIAVL